MSRYERRSNFALRAALCAVGIFIMLTGVAFSKFTSFDSENETLMAILKFSFPQTAMYVYFLTCYKPKFSVLFFCVTYAALLRNWASNIAKIFSGYFISGWIEFSAETFICAVFITAAYFVFSRRMKNFLVERMDGVYVWLINICTTLEMLLFMALSVIFSDKPIISSAINILNIAVGILLLCFYYAVAKKNYDIEELIISNYAAKTEHKQYEDLKRNADAVNAKWHDLKYYIAAFESSGKINKSEIDELKRITDGYGENISTGNEALNVVLSDKSLLCNQKGIAFQCFADGDSLFFMSELDIFSLFGNMIDNAVEYVSLFDDEEKRYVSLHVKRVSSFLSVSCENYYDGEAKTSWGTTKNNKFSHGFGLGNIRAVAEKYGGQMNVSVKKRVFSVNIALPIPK